MPLQTEDAPSVPEPTCSGDPLESNTLQSKRSQRWEVVLAPRKRPLVVGSRCTPKSASAQNSSRR
jgi:hypothetical protein